MATFSEINIKQWGYNKNEEKPDDWLENFPHWIDPYPEPDTPAPTPTPEPKPKPDPAPEP